MKRFALLLLALLAALSLLGCSKTGASFDAEIIGVGERALTVRADGGAGFDEASVDISSVEPAFCFTEGQRVRITYSGDVAETYPVQLTATAIELISAAGERELAEGVSMDIEFTSSTACTLTIHDSDASHTYGRWYCIERLENGAWVSQPTSYEGLAAFTAEGFSTLLGKLTLEEDFGWLYGELPPGTYRLVKDFYANGMTYYVAAEFTVVD